jgi:hypothetical protein
MCGIGWLNEIGEMEACQVKQTHGDHSRDGYLKHPVLPIDVHDPGKEGAASYFEQDSTGQSRADQMLEKEIQITGTGIECGQYDQNVRQVEQYERKGQKPGPGIFRYFRYC